jgi:hypothetical protein
VRAHAGAAGDRHHADPRQQGLDMPRCQPFAGGRFEVEEPSDEDTHQQAVQPGLRRIIDPLHPARRVLGKKPKAEKADENPHDHENHDRPGRSIPHLGKRNHGQAQGEHQIELFLDAQGPGVRKSPVRGDIEADVLGKVQQFPQRRQGLPLPGPWKKNIEGQDKSVRRQDSKGPFDVEPLEGHRFARVHLGQQLGMDQVTTQDEKQIHPRPSKFAEAGFKPSRVTEEELVVEEQDRNDRVGAKRLQSVKFRFHPGSGGDPD